MSTLEPSRDDLRVPEFMLHDIELTQFVGLCGDTIDLVTGYAQLQEEVNSGELVAGTAEYREALADVNV